MDENRLREVQRKLNTAIDNFARPSGGEDDGTGPGPSSTDNLAEMSRTLFQSFQTSRSARNPSMPSGKSKSRPKSQGKISTVTFKLFLLGGPGQKTLSSKDVTALVEKGLGSRGRTTFPQNMTSPSFAARLLEICPELEGVTYSLHRLNPQRNLVALPETLNKPSDIAKALKRSALYIVPSSTITVSPEKLASQPGPSVERKTSTLRETICKVPSNKPTTAASQPGPSVEAQPTIIPSSVDVGCTPRSALKRPSSGSKPVIKKRVSFEPSVLHAEHSSGDTTQDQQAHKLDRERHDAWQKEIKRKEKRKSAVTSEPADGGIMLKFHTGIRYVSRMFRIDDDIEVVSNFLGSLEESTMDFRLRFPDLNKTIVSASSKKSLRRYGIDREMMVYVRWMDTQLVEECSCMECKYMQQPSDVTEQTVAEVVPATPNKSDMSTRTEVATGTPTVTFYLPEDAVLNEENLDVDDDSDLIVVNLTQNGTEGSENQNDGSAIEFVALGDEGPEIFPIVVLQENSGDLVDEADGVAQLVDRSDQSITQLGNKDDAELVDAPTLPFVTADFVPLEFLDDPESAFQAAIQSSLKDLACDEIVPSNKSEETYSLNTDQTAQLIRQHSERVVPADFRSVSVSRTCLWRSFLPYMRRKAFIAKQGQLSITFCNDEQEEDAADLGGPRREFFRLLKNAICNDSGVLDASPTGMLFRPNITAYKEGLYRMIGQMFSMCIVQGGEPPSILSRPVVDYVMTGDITRVNASIMDVHNRQIRDDLQKIEAAQTEEELQDALNAAKWRSDIEGLPFLVRLEQKKIFVQEVALYFTVLRSQGMLDQFIDGLHYYEVLELIRGNGLRCVLQFNESALITAENFLNTVKPHYSPKGSNRRCAEELTLTVFREFLFKVEDRDLPDFLSHETLPSEMEQFVRDVTLQHLLAFTTGASQPPATGFEPSPRIVFIHDNTKVMPAAQTCSNELMIFINEENMDLTRFSMNMVTSLMNGAIFSTV